MKTDMEKLWSLVCERCHKGTASLFPLRQSDADEALTEWVCQACKRTEAHLRSGHRS